jgi:hypothetical protein
MEKEKWNKRFSFFVKMTKVKITKLHVMSKRDLDARFPES